METYTKPALKIDEQIKLLEDRNLQIINKNRVERHLSNISYYRLSAYMLPFKEKDKNHFINGTTWDDIYNLYKFDRKLRLLVFDAIERIEIALRAQIIYQLSLKYGSHWQNNKALFKKPYYNKKLAENIDIYKDIQKHINEELNSTNKSVFIKHYQDKYDKPATPPSWMSIELLYFSELSKICSGLSKKEDLAKISSYFKIHSKKVFCSWLHSINYVRNICAHHGRLWNITLAVQPAIYKKPDQNLIWLNLQEVQALQSSKMYYFLCVILYLLQTINPNTKFRQHFKDLLNEYSIVDVGYMGFTKDWKNHPLWK